MVTDEQATQNVVENELAKLKDSASVSEKLASKSAETDKLLEVAEAEVASVKQEVGCAASEKEKSNKIIVASRK